MSSESALDVSLTSKGNKFAEVKTTSSNSTNIAEEISPYAAL